MSSILSFIAGSLTSFDMFKHFFTNEEFIKLTNTLNKKGNMSVVVHDFVKNYLLFVGDIFVGSSPLAKTIGIKCLIDNKEIDAVFSNDSLSKKSQVKLCLGKVGTEIFTNLQLPEHIQVEKDVLIPFFCQIPDVLSINVDDVSSFKQLYAIIINTITNIVTDGLLNIINTITDHNEDNFNMLMKFTNEIIKVLNMMFDYKSPNISVDQTTPNKKRKRSDNNQQDKIIDNKKPRL